MPRWGNGRISVDLDAVRHNYRLLSACCAPASVAAVLKADAYGLGAAAILPTLLDAGCLDIFVADLAEAVELRLRMPTMGRVFVLNGVQSGYELECAVAGIIPVLSTVAQAQRWLALAQRINRPLSAALQIDSGMARLGLDLRDLRQLAGDQCFSSWVKPAMLISHLACADSLDHPENDTQLMRFQVIASYFPRVPRSLANSAGIGLGGSFHCEGVRTGIGLFDPETDHANRHQFHSVVKIDARVLQISRLRAGRSVGYGLEFRADRAMRIATIGLGYADGWPRSLGNRGFAFFRGFRLPMIGRVSMDMMTVDISAVPDHQLEEGDWLELVGPHQSLRDIASAAGTIPYEILAGLGRRYQRLYLDGAETIGSTGA